LPTALGTDPAARYTLTDELGKTETTVGYGRGGTGSLGATIAPGTKRAGPNVLDLVSGKTMMVDFDDPNNPSSSSMGTTVLAQEYLPAPGDSGGANFVNVGGLNYIAGITSFSSVLDGVDDSDYGDRAGMTRVSQFNAWVDSQIAFSWNQAAGGAFGTVGNWS